MSALLSRLSRFLFVAFVVLVAATAVPRVAHADDPPKKPADLTRRPATFTWEPVEKGPDRLLASFKFGDVADAALRNKLSSGLPTVVVMRAYLLRDGETDPIALAARTCRVTYDLWDSVYRLQISGPGGVAPGATYNVDGVLRQCFEANKLLIADRSLVKAGAVHFLAVIVEVNPVNQQMVDDMRKWVTRPAGSTGIGPGDALFGSFVGLFVRGLGKADRTLQFRTQPVGQ